MYKHFFRILVVLLLLTGQAQADIWEAAIEGDVEAVKKYLAKGVDVNAKDKDGETPLHEAARYGRTEVVKLLIDKGANIKAKSIYHRTPLYDGTA